MSPAFRDTFMLHKEAITRSHNVRHALKEIAGLIKIDYHHWTTK